MIRTMAPTVPPIIPPIFASTSDGLAPENVKEIEGSQSRKLPFMNWIYSSSKRNLSMDMCYAIG